MDLALTNMPLFLDKAQVFQSSVFVIGWDTYVRLVDQKYYPEGLEAALQSFRDQYVSFVVGARNGSEQDRP